LLRIERVGTIRATRTWPAMCGLLTRKIILGLCTLGAGQYPIARDDRVRAQARLDWRRFLKDVFAVH